MFNKFNSKWKFIYELVYRLRHTTCKYAETGSDVYW